MNDFKYCPYCGKKLKDDNCYKKLDNNNKSTEKLYNYCAIDNGFCMEEICTENFTNCFWFRRE